jgi:predicted RNA-binding protein
MCQATVYLDGKKIMEDVLVVEPIEDGIQLVKLFEPIQLVQASIRKIDLMKHKIFLETAEESGKDNE